MPGIIGLDHVGIAVRDLDAAVETFEALLGDGAEAFREDEGRELNDDGEVLEEWRMAYLDTGNRVYVELLEPGEVGEGPIGRFVERNGEGIHHVSFMVSPRSEFGAFFGTLSELGFETVGEEPWRSAPETERDNRYTYIHPHDGHGTLIELIAPYEMDGGKMEPAETTDKFG